MYIYINLYAYMYVHIYRKNRCGTTIFFTTILFHRFRKFANMNIQVPHFRGGFGITPNEGSAISAFYSATCALVVWLGSHGGNRPAQGFANTWAPGLNLTSPDSWHAPLLQALSHRMLFSCRIMGVSNGPLSPIECPRLWRSRLHSLLCSQV